MTPKEKAKYLVKKFEDESLHFEDTILDTAKFNSLLCVDEIINACEFNHVERFNTDWWNKVKDEINKL